MAESHPQNSENIESPVEVVELNEAGLVLKVLESGREYGIAVNQDADGEEIAVTELDPRPA